GGIAWRPRREAEGALANPIATERTSTDSFLCPLQEIGPIRFQAFKTNADIRGESALWNGFRGDADAGESRFALQRTEGGAISSRRRLGLRGRCRGRVRRARPDKERASDHKRPENNRSEAHSGRGTHRFVRHEYPLSLG